VLGGYLVENVSWRAAFLINVPLAVVVLLIVARHVPESRDPDARRLDIPGAVLATLGLGGIVFGLIESQSVASTSPSSSPPCSLGWARSAAFAFVEARSDEPMMPPSACFAPATSAGRTS
jgi:MFS family permease